MGTILTLSMTALYTVAGGLVCNRIDCKWDLVKRDVNGEYDSFLTRRVTVVNGLGSWSDPKVAGVTLYGVYDTDSYSNIFESPKYTINETNPWHDFGPFDNHLHSFYITNSGSDPICVAGVSVNTPKGPLVISGNLAKVCHVNSYESQVNVLTNNTACVWIDRHGTNGIQVQGLSFDVSGMDEEKTETSYFLPNTTEDLCTAPFIYSGIPPSEAKRSLASPATTFDFRHQLVKSGRESNSAVRLCGDKFTKGPDLVSLSEHLYCDMESRILYPVCDDSPTLKGPCFDVGQDELVEMGEHVPGEKRDLQTAPRKVMKSFEKVQLWN